MPAANPHSELLDLRDDDTDDYPVLRWSGAALVSANLNQKRRAA